jgi:hypothetical protein
VAANRRANPEKWGDTPWWLDILHFIWESS